MCSMTLKKSTNNLMKNLRNYRAKSLTFWWVNPLLHAYRNATSKDSNIKHFFHMGRSGIFVIKIWASPL